MAEPSTSAPVAGPNQKLLQRWRKGCHPAPFSTAGPPTQQDDNPFLALLALADRFVVTSDSVSMMVEVASLGRPLAIFSLPPGRSLADRLAVGGLGMKLPAWATHLLHRLGIAGYGRDLGEIRRVLIERGLAVPLGQPFRTTAAPLATNSLPWRSASAVSLPRPPRLKTSPRWSHMARLRPQPINARSVDR